MSTRAITELRAAVEASVDDDPHLAASLVNLGNAPLLAHDDGSDAEAGLAFRNAAESQATPPRVRIESARAAGRLAAGRLATGRRGWALATQSLEVAVGLLDRAMPPSHSRSDREHQLKRLRDLSCDAAACAVQSGDADRAAVLFEQGRGMLLAQALSVRADLDELARLLSGVVPVDRAGPGL